MKRSLPLLVLICLCASLSTRAAVPPPETLLSSDTLGFLSIPDYVKAKAVWSQWPTARLWNDPALKPFREKITTKLTTEYIAPLERELGVKFADYTDLAQGQVTFGVTQGEWDGKSDKGPGFVLLVDSKDKSDQLKTRLGDVRKKWVDGGKQMRSEKIRDVDFTTLVFKSDDLSKTLDKAAPKKDKEKADAAAPAKPATPHNLELLVGQSGSLLILATSAKDVERLLIRQSGGSVPSLGEQADFASNAKLFRDSSIYAWIHVKPIIETFTKNDTKADKAGLGLSSEKMLSAAGISALQTLAFSLNDSPDGLLAQVQLNVPESSRKGILKILSYDAKDAGPLPFVPADAVKFTRWRLDLQKGWNTFENMMGEINPQFAGGIKMMVDLAGKDKDPDFDLRKSLIANLGDDIISYQKPARGQTFADLSSPPSVTLISSPKAETLAASIRSLAAFLPQAAKIKEREFLGRKVYAMNLPSTPAPGQPPQKNRILSYAASGGYVVFSSDVATLEEYLRGNTPSSLKDAPGLTEAAQKIGGMGTGLFGYENQAETMRATLETLKKESGALGSMLKAPFAQGGEEGDSKFKEWFDFTLLPSFDRISKYFYFTVWGGSVTSDGLNVKMFAPMPPQLKK